jgi:hypothetical protein
MYIVRGDGPSISAGPNISLAFAVLMRHNEFDKVSLMRSTEYEAEYATIKDRRQMRKRRDALDAKIELSQVCIQLVLFWCWNLSETSLTSLCSACSGKRRAVRLD